MGTATAVAVVDGIKRRLYRGGRRPLLPWKLQEGLEHLELPLQLLHLGLTGAMTEDQYSSETRARTRRIKRVLYELEDLFDDLENHRSVRHPANRRTWKATLFWLSSPLLLHTTVAHRLNTISRKLDYVVEDLFTFCSRRRTSSLPKQYKEQLGFDGAAIIGRDREKQDIKELLLQNNDDNLSILPIVGPPGLGKTSLARLVFEDEGEGWDFDLRIWISLDMNLDLAEIAIHIISEANKSVKERTLGVRKNYAPFELKNNVQEILHNSSCLIVLDNLICMNENWLYDLKEMLGAKQKCAKVIVTTSCELVAEVMRTTSSYKLGCLSEEDCWTIFSEKAFGNKDAIVDPQYKEIGNKIVKRCNGIPILAQSLGSMVHNQAMNTWLAARDDDLWNLEERLFPKSKFFSSFKEIYCSMNNVLQSCFLYLSVFPRGSSIEKDELIRQWIALDLLRSELGIFSAFVVGQRYIQDLLSVSFLEVVDTSLVEMKCNSSSVVLHMHNLVYDFVRYLARDDVLNLDYGKGLNGSIGSLLSAMQH